MIKDLLWRCSYIWSRMAFPANQLYTSSKNLPDVSIPVKDDFNKRFSLFVYIAG